MKKFCLAILICLSCLGVAQAKTEDTTSIMAPVSIYGTYGSNVVPVKVGSDGTVAMSGAVTATVSGVSTAAAQTDGSQKSKIVDGSGNVIGATSNALDVNLKSGSIANTSFASTIADGANVTLGAKADNKSTATDTTAVSAISLLKEISYMEQNPASRIVTGTFWQTTQPVSTVNSSATLIHKTVDFAASETAQAIWTPASGKKFVITDIIISCSAAGTITVFDSTDSTANRVVKGSFAANGGLTHPYSKSFVSATADNVLKYTTGAGIAGSITVSGYEI